MNKNIILIIIISALFFQYILNAKDYLSDIQFTDEKSGWISTKDGDLFKTENGGISWYTIKTPANGRNLWPRFFAFSEDLIYIIVDHKELWCTQDGGQSWAMRSFPNYVLSRIYFIDANFGFISGQNEESYVMILRTEDGGQNWYQASIDSLNSTSISEVQFFNKKIGYGIGYEFIYRTEDGGRSWERKAFIDYITHGGVESGAVLDSNIIVINQWEPRVVAEGFLRISWDGGTNWSDYGKRKYFHFGIRDHHFFSEDICWVTTGDSLFKTINHGKNWDAIRLPIKRFHFIKKGLGNF